MDSLLGKESVSIEDMECHLKMREQVRVSGERQAEREHIAIEDMEYHLKMHERVRVREREQEEREHQLARREERLQWTKTPIDLADLFKARSLNPDGTVEEIKRVLLIGEPGTGKTALTKKIAYDWARGKWGLEFEAVYILPVRKLRGRNQGLAAAIVEEFLPEVSRTHGPSYNWWLDHVKALLQKPVTLVVLDGLDERYGVRQDVLEEAQNGSHKLLLTSRPYGIDDVMCKLADIANIQVEHMGLNDAQRDRFVHRVLAKSEGDVAQNLLAFIETHRLEEISRVPVNLQILCELWNNEQGNEIGSRSTRIGLPWLYRKMVDYIWERFEREGARRLYTDAERYYTFIDLGKIALKTLEKGEIIIRRTTIEDILGRGPSAVLQDTGLLKSVDRQYQFPHLTFHEYFAGRRLAVQFLPDKSRNGNQDAVREFLEEHMYKPEYRRALLFMVGEVTKGIPQELRLDSPRKHTEHIGSLLELVDEASVEHGENTEVQHLLLQLSLVNEWLLAADMREKEQGKALRELDKQFKFERSLLEYFNIGLYQAKSDQGKVVDLATLKDILSLLFASSNALVAHYGKRILSFIEQTLIDTKPSVRLSGVSILPSLTPDGMTMETVLGHLETSCSDGDAGVKAASCDALAVLTETTRGDNLERIFLQIKKILQGDESSVRESASRALSTFVKQADGQEIVLPLFKSALKDNNAYVRQGVLRALVDFIGSEVTLEEALSLIATDLKGNEVNTREAAVTTLVSLVKRVDGIEVLLPLCKQLLQDNDACIRKITLEVLPALTDRGAVAEAKSIFSDVKNTLDVSEVSHLLYSAAEKGHLEIVKHIYKENCEVDLEILDEDGCTPLYIAAQNGHLEIVQYLKEHGAKCDTSNNSGMTPVNIAAQNGHLAAIQYLKEQGVRLDTPNNEGMTSAHLSAQNGHLAVVTYLKDNGVRVDTPNENGITPIYLAVQNGHLEVVIYLNGIQVIIPNGITLLHYAALTGQVKIARYLVEQGAKVDALANNEMTPLHYAAFVGQVKVAKYLVEQGAKVDALANNEMTPLHCAALTGPVRVARYLVRHIDINDKNYMRLMHIAAQNGHIKLVEYLREQVYKSNKEDNALLQIAVQHGRLEVVKYFIRKVNRINTPDNNGWTAMHLAAHNGYLEIVTYLRDNGAQVDMAAKDDMTPLHLAAQNGHLPVVIYLQEQGGQVDAVSRNGMTPLHLAVENGHLPVVIYLQEHGGQVDAVSKNGMAPLHLAAQNGHSKVLMYLKDHGAYIETAMKYDYNNRGMTPLHLAAQNGHLMIVTYLVNDNKVNVNVHNSQYQTPLQLAKRNNHQAVVDFLETHGAQ
ncbi:MAG: ankyrin repeat domain-containing protein [Bacteroidota bacterium]